jgi:hypothetical protein
MALRSRPTSLLADSMSNTGWYEFNFIFIFNKEKRIRHADSMGHSQGFILSFFLFANFYMVSRPNKLLPFPCWQRNKLAWLETKQQLYLCQRISLPTSIVPL